MQNKSAKNIPNGFIPIPFLILLVVIGTTVTAIKVTENPRILGSSTYLAQGVDGTGSAPGGGSPTQQAPSQPQSQPQQQQPQSQPQQNPQPQQNNPNPGTLQKDFRPMNQQNSNPQQNPNPGGSPQKDFKPKMENSGEDKKPPLNQPNGQQDNNQPFKGQPNGQQKFQELSKEWQNDASKFGFQIQNPENGSNNFPSIQGNFNVDVQRDGKAEQLDLNDKNTRVNLGSFQAVRPDGTKVEINKDAKEKINAAIKLITGSEVSQNGNTFTLKRGDVSVKTDLPISFNVASKTFTVQTASGEQEVKVLPDEVLAKIKEENADFSADEGDVNLEEFNNKPVYRIPGQKRQRFLGFIPVGIQQTSVVSAEDGNVVTTDQSTISKILDTLSF